MINSFHKPASVTTDSNTNKNEIIIILFGGIKSDQTLQDDTSQSFKINHLYNDHIMIHKWNVISHDPTYVTV